MVAGVKVKVERKHIYQCAASTLQLRSSSNPREGALHLSGHPSKHEVSQISIAFRMAHIQMLISQTHNFFFSNFLMRVECLSPAHDLNGSDN